MADVLPEPIIAAPASPGPWRDCWLLSDYRSAPAPVVAEAFLPIRDLPPCSAALARWPQDTGLVAELAAVANEVRAKIAKT